MFVLVLLGLLLPMSSAHADGASDADANNFLAQINQLRASVGAQPLVLDAQLNQVAAGWSQVMASQGTISHNPDLRAQLTGVRVKLGENVGMGPSVDSVFAAFVASPHHYENLTDPSFSRVGVSVIWVGSTLFTTHDFAAVGSAPAQVVHVPAYTPAPAPAPKPAPVRVAAAPAPAKPLVTTTAPPPPSSTTTTTVAPVPAPEPAPALQPAMAGAGFATSAPITPPRRTSPLPVVVAVLALATVVHGLRRMLRHR